MIFNRKKKKAVSNEKERMEYEREYEDDFDEEEPDKLEQSAVDKSMEQSVSNSVLLKQMGFSDELIVMLRNAFFVEGNDSSKDIEIAALEQYDMFERLLELRHLYDVADYIDLLLKEIYGISLHIVADSNAGRVYAKKADVVNDTTDEEDENDFDDEDGGEQVVEEAPLEVENAKESASDDSQSILDDANEMQEEMTLSDDDLDDEEEILYFVLKVIDADGQEKKYLLSDLTEEENMDLLDMLVDANEDGHITDVSSYLESLGAVVSDAEEYDDEDVYFIYDTTMNVVIDDIDEAV